MRIRAAEAGDLETLAAIYGWYVEHSYATFALDAPSVGEWTEDFAIAEERGFPWLVGVEDDAVIGYTRSGSFFPRRGYDSSVMSAIYLDRAQIGRGFGRPLYAAALDRLKFSPFHLAVAGIALPNAASQALHESSGFAPVGTFREVGHKLGAWRDVSWWQLALD